MTFNKTVKYFKSIRVFVHCEICNEIVGMDINKEELRTGLEAGFFLYKYKHKNEASDPDDASDESWKEHNCAVYIDDKYQVKQVKSYFGDEIVVSAVQGDRIPVVIKKVPAAAVRIGMLTQDQFKIIQLCDGTSTLTDIANIAEISIEDLDQVMDELRSKGMINIIIRS
jgi:hypothetical protein